MNVPDQTNGDSPYPFSGRLIGGSEAAQWLRSNIEGSKGKFSLCSAFLRSESLEFLFSGRNAFNGCRILTRWQFNDLCSGASDLSAYVAANAMGIPFYLKQDFHGKVFSINDVGIIVGSANATLSGFGLSAMANTEMCTLVPAETSNLNLIDQLFRGAVELTPSLFNEIKNVIEELGDNQGSEGGWSDSLSRKLQPQIFTGRLMLSECLNAPLHIDRNGGVSITSQHDLELLGVRDGSMSPKMATAAFKSLRIYRWLHHTLASNNNEIYFGKLTEELHNSLLQDPILYRKEVKTLLQNLLDWCSKLPHAGVMVDRPGYSQRVRLVEL